MIEKSLEQLVQNNRITAEKRIVLWGIGNNTQKVADWLYAHGFTVWSIVDNFKYTFYKEFRGIPVKKPDMLQTDHENIVALLAVNFSDAIRRQLLAYGITEVYNLQNPKEQLQEAPSVAYHFTDRQKREDTLCYIMAGYEKTEICQNVLERIYHFAHMDMDICIVSSGIYVQELADAARRYGWSYLSTEENQVCFIQNLVIQLHPAAKYIFKLDEDIFISKGYFEEMKKAYQKLEEAGEYRIGFLVPVIPVNCYGYRSFLNTLGKTGEYEEQFGRAYRSRFAAVFSLENVAEYLWRETGQMDACAAYFRERRQRLELCCCYFNIGAILYTRERWLLMGRWPHQKENTGMGLDESTILRDSQDKDMAVYEVSNVLAGHLAFGHQKQRMYQYFMENRELFAISDE